MSGDRAALRAYRAVLRLYPHEFRGEYGDDMVQLLRDQLADEPAWRVVARAVVDLAITIPSQHLEAHMNRPSTHLVPLLYTALAGGGLLFAAIGGTNIGVVVIGLLIALIAGTTAGIAWRRSGPLGGRISTDRWWMLALSGPLIVVAVLLAAGLGVDAWIVGMLAVLVAFVLSAIGVLMGIVHLARRHSSAVPT